MGIRAVFANAAATIFTALGDIPQSATYRRTTTTVYDPTTGNYTSTNSDTTISAIFTRFSEMELGRSPALQLTDVKMILQQASLAITPSIQLDTIINGGNTYNIVNFNPDPAGATYVFQLRAP